jgi:hypothetical protein
MSARLYVLTAALVAGTAWAAEGNPLESTECRKALDALQAQEAAVTAQPEGSERRAVPPALEAARRRAAVVCLGSRADAPPPSGRLAQPPVSVAPITVAPAAPPAPARPAPPLPRPAPPTVVTACDSLGCWASDGTRLQRVGPNLFGPRGLCIVQGAVVSCP